MTRCTLCGISLLFVFIVLPFNGCNKNNVRLTIDNNEYFMSANHVYYNLRDHQEALKQYEKIQPDSVLYPAALMKICLIYEESQDWSAVLSTIEKFEKIRDQVPFLYNFFLLYKMKALYNTEDYRAVTGYEGSVDSVGDEYLRSEAYLMIAMAYEKIHEEQEALRLYRNAFSLKAASAVRYEIREQYRRLVFSRKFTVSDVDLRLMTVVPEQYVSDVVPILQDITDRTEQWWKTYTSIHVKKRFKVADGSVNGYILAEKYTDIRETDKRQFLKNKLNDPAVVMKKPLIMLYLLDHLTNTDFTEYQGQLTEAEYRKVVSEAPAQFLARYDHYGLIEFFDLVTVDRLTRNEQAKSWFWMGYLQRTVTGDTKKAELYFKRSVAVQPFTYYHAVISSMTDISFTMKVSKTGDSGHPALKKLITALTTFGDKEAVFLIQRYIDDREFMLSYHNFLSVYDMYHQYPREIEAASHLVTIYQNEPDIVRWLYPEAFTSELDAAASVYTLCDKDLVLAIMHQESSFRPEAISRVGAVGLMQLMPSTARPLIKKFFPDDKDPLLTDPVVNITCGMYYLNSMIERYGKTEFALAAYNAGPGITSQWIRSFGDRPIVEFVEMIPYYETRDYVKNIIKKQAIYGYFRKEGRD